MRHLLLCFCAVSSFRYGSCDEIFDKCNNINQQQPTRPCPSSSLPCIRSYFVDNSVCRPIRDGEIYDTLEVDSVQFYFPYVNATSVQYNMKISGLSTGKVQDFIVDTNTDLVVLTLNFKNLEFMGKTRMFYLRPYDEPTIIISDTVETYPEVTLTVVITNAKNLNIDESTTVAYIHDIPNYDLGPCYTESEDEVVQTLYRAFAEAPRIATQEAFLSRGQIISKHFIENLICDFLSNDVNSLPRNIEHVGSHDSCNNCDTDEIHEPLDNEILPVHDIYKTNYGHDIGDHDSFENIKSSVRGDEDNDYSYGSDCAFYDIPFPPLLYN